MQKYGVFLLLVLCIWSVQSQNPIKTGDTLTIAAQDSIRKSRFFKQLGNGFFPTQYIDIDLRYFIKYNQYEGIRTGVGGRTNDQLSDKYRINGYVVYGFKDRKYKYGITGGFRVSKASATWINFSYTDDLKESGSSSFLTDKRFFSFFEPRLLNISLFHHHITKSVSIEHRITPYLLSEVKFSKSNINPTYNYAFVFNDRVYERFKMSLVTTALQWNPFNTFEKTRDIVVEKENYPNFSLQITKGFKNIWDSDFDFTKIDFRSMYRLEHANGRSFSEATLTGGLATGQVPLTDLYHAYPNNINKHTILNRFSVAGINSFETMYFNEFFSSRLATLQLKHALRPFNITKKIQPQLVLISRFALGNMSAIERHQGITFNTLNKGYSEAGLELNQILFGFGLSFAYRYGAYHLPKHPDNLALKFTFNLNL